MDTMAQRNIIQTKTSLYIFNSPIISLIYEAKLWIENLDNVNNLIMAVNHLGFIKF